MKKEEKLKYEILNQFKSIREFSKSIGIPNSTIVSALKKGIGGMSIDKVIKICDKLDIDIKTFDPIEKISPAASAEDNNKYKSITDNLDKLNENGVEAADDYIEYLTKQDKYKKYH